MTKADIKQLSFEDLENKISELNSLNTLSNDNDLLLAMLKKEQNARRKKEEKLNNKRTHTENEEENIFGSATSGLISKNAVYIPLDDIVMPEELNEDGVEEGKIDDIDRTGIDEDKINDLAETIDTVGLLYEPILEPLPNGKYRKLCGRRRIRAHKKLKKQKIRSKVTTRVLTEKERDLIIFIENIQREDLNEYDLVKGHVVMVLKEIYPEEWKNMTLSEGSKIIRNVEYYSKDKNISAENKIRLDIVMGVIASLKSFNTLSSLTKKLQVLNMSKNLIDGLFKSKITFKVAEVLHGAKKKLTPYLKEDEIVSFQNEIIEVGNSYSEAKVKIEALKNSFEVKDSKSSNKSFKTKLSLLSKNYDNLDSQNQKYIEKLLEDALKKLSIS